MFIRSLIAVLLLGVLMGTVWAENYLRDQREVSAMLAGTILQGTYLRTQSAYSLQFNKDGSLINQKGEQGNWWANEKGQYCRKWSTGRMKGHEACLDLAQEGEQIAIYSNGKKVAIGNLVRNLP